jgi:hypothetical protein
MPGSFRPTVSRHLAPLLKQSPPGTADAILNNLSLLISGNCWWRRWLRGTATRTPRPGASSFASVPPYPMRIAP